MTKSERPESAECGGDMADEALTPRPTVEVVTIEDVLV